MSEVTVNVQSTPNPNTLKFTLNVPVTSGQAKSFFNAQAGQADPLAKQLFAIPGVKSCFMINDFVSITRDPAASWDALVAHITSVLQAHFAAR